MKKQYIKSVSAALLCSTLLFTGCKDLTDGLSTDPVNVTDPSVISTDKFLSGAQVSLIGIYEGDMNRLTGMWTGHFSGEDRQYIGLSNYGVSGRDFNTEWAGIYASVLKNTSIIKSRNHKEGNTLMLGIVQVMEAMAYGLAADLWGDVPFTEAIKYPDITSPKFDAQASVYNSVQVLLDSAIINLALPDVPTRLRNQTSGGDFFFNGDATAWTAVANTLKARFYLHAKDYNRAAAFAALGVSDPAGNLMAPHGTTYLQNFNLFYSFLVYDRPGYMGGNGYAPTLLDPDVAGSRNNAKTDEAARLNYYYIPGAGIYTGGAYETNFLNDYDWGTGAGYDGFFGAQTAFPMVTYMENLLILAEANLKNSDPDAALDALNELRAYYNNGGYWSPGYNDDFPPKYEAYDLSDFDAGTGIENQDGIASNDALLREIIEERYITLTGTLEVFNDIRRTDNLLNVPIKGGNPVFPQRLLYPQSELNTNDNVPTASVGLFDATTVNKTPY